MIQAWLAGNALKLGIAVTIAAAVVLLAMRLQYRLDDAKYQALVSANAQALVRAKDAAIQKQTEMQGAVDAARGDLDATKNEIGQRERDIAALRSDVSGLRLRIKRYSAPPAGGAPQAPCTVISETLGELAAESIDLLDEGRNLLAACAASNDSRAAEVRALISAWPK